MQNAKAILGRLQRLAKLQPSKEKEALEEFLVIENLFHAGCLPEGPPAVPTAEPEAQPPASPTIYNCLYIALSGRRPPAAPHPAKFSGRWGQSFFLSTDGSLRQGLTPRRSVGLPKDQLEALRSSGRAMLASGKAAGLKPSTLADLKGIF